MTVGQAVRAAATVLERAGVPSPRHDAEELAAFLMGAQRAELLRRPDAAIDADAYDALVTRRAAREPLQHITGRAGFRYLEVAVGPGVFVPRPETELLAGAAVAACARRAAPLVVDLCTGSGVVALAVATEVPEARVVAVELSPEAHAWAARNLVGSAVRLVLGDAAEALPELDGSVDVVVANPPYIPPDGLPREPEARDHDPALALYGGGEDGLDTVRAVVARAHRLLREGGDLLVEHADSQEHAVTAMLAAGHGGPWTDVEDHQDLAGRPRYTTARRGRGSA